MNIRILSRGGGVHYLIFAHSIRKVVSTRQGHQIRC